MPSFQKHKKKSRKQKKRHVTPSTDSDGDRSKNLMDSDGELEENEEELTSLVRSSYASYLRQALIQNIEKCSRTHGQSEPSSLQDLAYNWSTVLEQKALKACTVPKLYRKTMVSFIRRITRTTNNETLCIEDRKLASFLKDIQVHRGTQTVIPSESGGCDTGTQTEPSAMTSLLDLPMPMDMEVPYDPAIIFSDSQSSCADVSSSLLLDNLDTCVITSTTDTVDNKSVCCKNIPKNKGSNSSQISSGILPLKLKSCETDESKEPISESCDIVIPFLNNEDRNVQLTSVLKRSEIKDRISVQQNLLQKDEMSGKSVTKHDLKKNLDDRLHSMGLFNDSESDPENGLNECTLKPKKSNWYAEEIAQSCNLTRVLLKMSTKQREKTLKRIKELFGVEEDEVLTELSERNIHICRKRIASVVVMELTPIYKSKRIASRRLFKSVAKQITNLLMDNSYAPDSRTIRLKVKDCFHDGIAITSESDCEKL